MNNGIILGIDFSADYTQVSILCDDNTPETQKMIEKAEEFLMPTTMFYNTDLSEWAVGFEAYNRSRVEGGVFIDKVSLRMKESIGLIVDGKSVKWKEIAMVFFSKVIEQVIGGWGKINIYNIVVSVDDPDEIIMQSLYSAF